MLPSSDRPLMRRSTLIWVVGLAAGIAVGGAAAYGLTSVTRAATVVSG